MKNLHVKRLISLLMVIVLMLGVFVGCGKSSSIPSHSLSVMLMLNDTLLIFADVTFCIAVSTCVIAVLLKPPVLSSITKPVESPLIVETATVLVLSSGSIALTDILNSAIITHSLSFVPTVRGLF